MSSSEEMRAGSRKAANMRLVVSLRPLIMAAFGQQRPLGWLARLPAAAAEAFGLAS